MFYSDFNLMITTLFVSHDMLAYAIYWFEHVKFYIINDGVIFNYIELVFNSSTFYISNILSSNQTNK